MKEANVAKGLVAYQSPEFDDFIDLIRSPLAKYNEELVKQFGFLDTQGLALDDDDNENGRVHIDQLYVLPDVSTERISPESIASIEIDGVIENVENRSKITEVLKSTPRLALLGDPGVGKTTLVQWLICSLCHMSDTHAKQQLGNIFPLLAIARKISPDFKKEISVDMFLEYIIKSQGDSLAEHLQDNRVIEVLYSLFVTGQIILIVDGLDEVSDEITQWLGQNIKLLLSKYPRIRLLITSRVVGYDNYLLWGLHDELNEENTFYDGSVLNEIVDFNVLEDISVDDFFVDHDSHEHVIEDGIVSQSENIYKYNLTHVYYLAPFTSSQRIAFARNWLNSYIPHNNDKRQEFLKGVHAVSKHSLQLNALSRIPVLLNLICFILYRRGKLPNGRAELYQRIVETYLVTMDKVRRIRKEISEEYDYNDIKIWLSKLALQMQAGTSLNMDTSIIRNLSRSELEDYREKIPEINDGGERILQVSEQELKNFFSVQLTEAVDLSTVEEHSQQLIEYIKHRTGFLIPKGQLFDSEMYGFSHLSFQEYFCAYAIGRLLPKLNRNKSVGQSILYTVSSASWSEIWQLVFEEISSGVASRHDVEEFLGMLFPSKIMLKPLRSPSINTPIPVEVILYSKIIANSAIKLSKASRQSMQYGLIKEYLINDYGGNNVLNELLQLLLREDSDFVKYIENEEYLCLTRRGVKDFSFLRKLNKVKSLCFHISKISDLDVIAHLTSMHTLYLGHTEIIDLNPIRNHSLIEKLYLHNTAISDLRPLRKLILINDLTLGNSRVKSIKSLKSLSRLERLYLDRLDITDFEPLESLHSLKILSLEYTKIKYLDVLKNSIELEELDLSFTKIRDLSPLKNLVKLKKLSLEGCDNIDLESLETLPKLDKIILPARFNEYADRIKRLSQDVVFV